MRVSPRALESGWRLVSFAAVLTLPIIAGCDSTPSADDPETKKQLQAQQSSVRKADEGANAALKKRLGKNAPQMKSIKGNIVAPGASTE
jgi:hypothetical protein